MGQRHFINHLLQLLEARLLFFIQTFLIKITSEIEFPGPLEGTEGTQELKSCSSVRGSYWKVCFFFSSLRWEDKLPSLTADYFWNYKQHNCSSQGEACSDKAANIRSLAIVVLDEESLGSVIA